MELKDGVSAIVTGGASGLGAGTARMLASTGAKVAIFDRDSGRGAALAAEIGGVFAEVDVTDQASVEAGFATARVAHGPERILINCAGIAPPAKTTSRGEPHPMDVFEKVIDVNLIGSFRCIAQAATSMAALEPLNADGARGVIVSTASVAAFDGQVGQVAYAASKAGVVGMTLPVARDLSKSGIRVCTIAPGIFETPMLLGLSDEVQKSLGQQVPFPARLGKAEEFARLVRSICENDMLNGETIRLDGAIRLAPR